MTKTNQDAIIGVDLGGTITHFLLVELGQGRWLAVGSTAEVPSSGLLGGVGRVRRSPGAGVGQGATVGTSAGGGRSGGGSARLTGGGGWVVNVFGNKKTHGGREGSKQKAKKIKKKKKKKNKKKTRRETTKKKERKNYYKIHREKQKQS